MMRHLSFSFVWSALKYAIFYRYEPSKSRFTFKNEWLSKWVAVKQTSREFIDRSFCSAVEFEPKFHNLYYGFLDKYYNGQYNYHWVTVRSVIFFSITIFTPFIRMNVCVSCAYRKICATLIVWPGGFDAKHFIQIQGQFPNATNIPSGCTNTSIYNTLQWSIDQMRFMQNSNHCMPSFWPAARNTHSTICLLRLACNRVPWNAYNITIRECYQWNANVKLHMWTEKCHADRVQRFAFSHWRLGRCNRTNDNLQSIVFGCAWNLNGPAAMAHKETHAVWTLNKLL